MEVRSQMTLVAATLACGCSLFDAAGGSADGGAGSGDGGGAGADAGGNVDGPAACRVVDDFEDGVIGDPWVSWNEDDASLGESGGALRVSFSGSEEAWAGYDLRDRIDFSEAEVRMEIATAGGSYTGFNLCFGDQELELYVEDSDVVIGEVFNTEDADDSGSLVYNPEDHRFLRIRATEGVVYWEVSSDEVDWDQVHTQPVPFPIDDVTVHIEAAGQSGDTPAAFEWFAATPTGCAQ